MALEAPASHAAIVVAFDGDEVDRAIKAHPEGLDVAGRFTAEEPSATVYLSDVVDVPSVLSSPRRFQLRLRNQLDFSRSVQSGFFLRK